MRGSKNAVELCRRLFVLGTLILVAKAAVAQPTNPPRSMATAMDRLYDRMHISEDAAAIRFRIEANPVAADGDKGQIPRVQIPHPRREEQELRAQQSTAKYYQQVAETLGLTEPPATLDVLLKHLGYEQLSAKLLEQLPPSELMGSASPAVTPPGGLLAKDTARPYRRGDALSVRFFSPKTSDVSGKVNPVALSWRKLTRLRAQPDSAAAISGVDSLFVLTNVYEPDLSRNPFDTESLQTQVIMTASASARHWPWPLAFLVFESLSQGGTLTDYSETSWDAVDPALSEEQINSRYYVPGACITCHGYDTSEARLQYLDSDYWMARVQLDDDFSQLFTGRWPPLFDAGSDPGAANFAETMNVLRQLNREILQQNQRVDGANGEPHFQTRAAEHWLQLHAERNAPCSVIERSLPPVNGQPGWNAQSPVDVATLRRLDRYCFRCHSSVAFHVMDRPAVADRAGEMVRRLQSTEHYLEDTVDDYPDRMPQDRTLPPEELQNLVDLLEVIELLETERDAAASPQAAEAVDR